MGAPFLTAEWRNIVMLNYEVPPELLREHVPAGTELDTFEGDTKVRAEPFDAIELDLARLWRW